VICAACWEAGLAVAESIGPEVDRGRAGASVGREYERRRSNREIRTREAHPRIGGLLLALRGAPAHETAFHRGELGEKAVAKLLEQRIADGPGIILHDRRMPNARGNIDHIAVTPSGVYVIDAKNISGTVRVVKPLFEAVKLVVAGRDRTRLVDGLDRQVQVVRGVLTGSGHPEVPVQGVLCFTSANLPLLGTPKIRGHLLLYRRALAKRLSQSGPLRAPAIDALAYTLAAILPPA
jgi:Nuclease-related domain